MGWLEVLLEFLSLIFVFAIIVALAYFTTKLVASSSFKKMKNRNIRVLEGITIAPQKSLQLVKVGKKVMLIGITRDNIVKLETLEENELEFSEKDIDQSFLTFKDVLGKTISKENSNSSNNAHNEKSKAKMKK